MEFFGLAAFLISLSALSYESRIRNLEINLKKIEENSKKVQ